jgi:uncharacterized membrane protein YgdD (TMEM256/DUF423 family)
MNQTFFFLGSVLGGLGVALGAFGAHGLKRRLSPERLETFESGVRYQVYHALALLAAGLLAEWLPGSGLASAAGWLFLGGVILFSGSLYLLVFTGQRRWGAVAPLGGLALIAGWACLALAAVI